MVSMMKPILGCAILITALMGGFLVGAINAVMEETSPDWGDDE